MNNAKELRALAITACSDIDFILQLRSFRDGSYLTLREAQGGEDRRRRCPEAHHHDFKHAQAFDARQELLQRAVRCCSRLESISCGR
eukprot:5810039-Lingulodinium_polyedra.AAC.1